MLLLCALGFFSGACAEAPPNPDVVEKTVIAEAGKSKHEGEPVTSSSVAIYLAELALQERGLDYAERNVVVSFCDGVYTVTFEHPPDIVLSHDYVVNVDAARGRVTEVITGE